MFFLIHANAGSQPSGWFPFNPPWNDSTHTEIDLRSMNDQTAGDRGFLMVNAAGHFYFEKTPNMQERLWGAQFFGAAQQPTHQEAEAIARHFSKIGFNLWKPGALQLTWNSAGFTNLANISERIDRFDYLFAQMKKNGVYCYLQLDEYGVGRSFADPKANLTDDFRQLGVQKTFFYQYLRDDEVSKTQRAYWKDLLTHKNPYTGLEYKDDPAVVIVEMTNENYILDGWLSGRIKETTFPGRFAALLKSRWNDWLKAKYSTINSLEGNWQLASGETAQWGMIPFEPVSPSVDGYPIPRKEDIVEFLTTLQRTYFDSVATFLKSLGVRALMNAGQLGAGGGPNGDLYSASVADIMDVHAYFDMPAGIGPTGIIQNLNPFNIGSIGSKYFSGGGTFAPSTADAIDKKPMIVSETNWSYPSQHEYLFIPQLVATASFQDWDGLILHAYALQMPWDTVDYIESQLVVRNNPVIMAQCVAGAIAFRTHQIAPAAQTVVLHYDPSTLSKDLFQNFMMAPDHLPRVYYFPAGSGSMAGRHIPSSFGLVHEIRKAFDGGSSSPDSVTGPDYVSDTHQIDFNTLSQIFTVSANGILSAGGKVGSRTLTDQSGKFSLVLTFDRDEYLSVSLVPLDGAPLASSGRFLLTIASQVENTGAVWKEQYKSASVWGKGPVLAKGEDGHVGLSGLVSAPYQVWGLTQTGTMGKRIASSDTPITSLGFDVRADNHTLWYLIERVGKN